jgi:hypothetical protein
MDINYLLKRHQISLMRAQLANCAEARLAHEGLARLYLAELRVAGYPGTHGMDHPQLC